jgi:tetratricopeptide (TPR) repeat protein
VLDEAAAHWRHIGDRRGEASALRRIGWTHLMAGDADRAEPFIREAYDAFSEIGVKRGVAWAQQHLAWIAFLRGDVGVAESRLVESNRLFAAIGDWGGQSWGNAMLVMVMYAQGRTDDAEVLAERVAHEAREQGDGWSLGLMSVVLARVRLWQGRISEAIERSQETRHNFASIHDPWMEVRALPPLSDALTALGRLDEAEAVIEQCDELVQQFPESSDDRAVPNVMRLQRAMRLGDVPAGLVAYEALSGARPTVLGFEALPLARTLVSLQAGRLDEAWSAVGELDLPAPREPVGLRAARTLLLAVDGQLAEAEAQSAEVLQGAGMYYERLLAHLAVAAVAVRTGDAGRARRNIDEADREVSVTDDVVSAAVVSRARAVVLAAIGHGGAQEAALAADRKAAALGVSLAGWSSVLWAAVRASSEPAPA